MYQPQPAERGGETQKPLAMRFFRNWFRKLTARPRLRGGWGEYCFFRDTTQTQFPETPPKKTSQKGVLLLTDTPMPISRKRGHASRQYLLRGFLMRRERRSPRQATDMRPRVNERYPTSYNQQPKLLCTPSRVVHSRFLTDMIALPSIPNMSHSVTHNP